MRMISVHFQSKPFSITVIQVCAPTTEAEEFRKPEIKFEPEIKLPTFAGSQRKQENSRKTSTSVSLTVIKPLTVWIITNWKVLKEMGIADHLTCLLRNLYAGQEATVRTLYGTTDWFKIEEGAR